MDGVLRWLRQDTNLRQVFIAVAVLAACWIAVHPRGTSGTGLAVVCLLVACSLLLLVRMLPLPPWALNALLVVSAIVAAALFALDRSGASAAFGFVVAGNAGFHLNTRDALIIAGLTSTLCAGVIVFHVGGGHLSNPWYLGALTGASVLVGIANRNRTDALRSAREAAMQAQLAAQSEARAQALAERGRIARDVHDVLAHSLAGVNMQLEVADAQLESGDLEAARAATRRAQSLVREGLVEVQRTVQSLREDALPLLDTLRSLLGSSTRDGEIEVVGEPREPSVRTAQALVRCAQEALTNAHKHAPDAAVALRIGYRPGHIELTVRNAAPATGTRPLAGSGSGMGLVGMRERVALLGGSVRIGPDDAGGWQVHVEVPDG